MSEEQTTADDPSDDRYWRNVLPSEILQPDDMMRTMTGLWLRTTVPGKFARDGCGRTYRRRIEQQQPKKPDDPSGDGWRWVCQGEKLELHDMMQADGEWWPTKNAGETCLKEGMYRRRIEQPQPSDSEPETMEQLREQVTTLTQELKDKSDSYQICLRDQYKAGQQAIVESLQAWLRPVVALIDEEPHEHWPIAVATLHRLPQIASRLIEE